MRYEKNIFYKVTEYAIKYLQKNDAKSPIDAWDIAVKELIGRPKLQKKHCPRGTFLELCQEGVVSIVKPGRYTKSPCEKRYAKTALQLLKKDSSLANSENASSELWKKVLKEINVVEKTHDRQMDVVLALWNNNVLL